MSFHESDGVFKAWDTSCPTSISYTCLHFCSSLNTGIVNTLLTTSNEAVCTAFSCTSIFSVASNFARFDFTAKI